MAEGQEESTGTIVLALVANAVIAVAKFVGAALSGSSAMASEGAHSVADTLNEAFLLVALRRSGKAPDRRHPFGHGKERYFWSLLAAVGIFVAGGMFSILEGIDALRHPEEPGSYLVSYIVLAAAFLLEGASWLKALRQLRRESRAAGRSLLRHLHVTPDPTVKTVAFEDTAALIGIVLAALGLLLHELTGNGVFDGLASLAIGLLLVAVAVVLGRDNKAALIGEAATTELADQIERELASAAGVEGVVELLTMQLGPGDVLVAARVDLAAGPSTGDVERLMEDADRHLRERIPEVRHVFLDPTPPLADPPDDAGDGDHADHPPAHRHHGDAADEPTAR